MRLAAFHCSNECQHRVGHGVIAVTEDCKSVNLALVGPVSWKRTLSVIYILCSELLWIEGLHACVSHKATTAETVGPAECSTLHVKGKPMVIVPSMSKSRISNMMKFCSCWYSCILLKLGFFLLQPRRQRYALFIDLPSSRR